MRPWSLISLLLLLLLGCAGCVVRVPQPGGVKVSLNASIRPDRANARVEVPPPPPPPPPPPVALQGAPVVEFFGIPLEGASDVVFVLDCSGSMSDLAQGAIARLSSSPPPGDTIAPAGPAEPPGPDQPPSPGPDQPPPPGAAPPPPPPPGPLRKIDVAREELADAIRRLPAGTLMDVIFFSSEVEAFAPAMVPLEDTGRDGLIGFVRTMTAAGSTALAPAMRTAFLMNARRIVLLSDGMGNVGGDARSLIRDAREAMRGGVRIDTIGLGHQQDAALLQALARESGGIYQAL